jgi:cytochrome c oxidase cbb3-type subunit 2
MVSFHTSHRLLLIVPATLFAVLTAAIAIVPAVALNIRHGPTGETAPVAADVERGRRLYIAEGCGVCHTQQVRVDTRRLPDSEGRYPPLAQDVRYGRPSVPADYALDDPPLLGTERTGPDLQNIGDRLPSADWHYTHLFDPRIVSPDSIMPSYRWYFRTKEDRRPEDRRVLLTDTARDRLGRGYEVWATPDAQDLIAYLLSLRPATRDR